MSFRDKEPEYIAQDKPDPAEVTVASAEAVYVWAGRLEDGTAVVRDSDGLLHALTAVKRARQDEVKLPA